MKQAIPQTESQSVAPNAAAKARKASKLAEKLRLYPLLPDEAFVDIDVVCALYGRCRASVYRDVKTGRVPAPHSVGTRSTRWRVGDLRGH